MTMLSLEHSQPTNPSTLRSEWSWQMMEGSNSLPDDVFDDTPVEAEPAEIWGAVVSDKALFMLGAWCSEKVDCLIILPAVFDAAVLGGLCLWSLLCCMLLCLCCCAVVLLTVAHRGSPHRARQLPQEGLPEYLCQLDLRDIHLVLYLGLLRVFSAGQTRGVSVFRACVSVSLSLRVSCPCSWVWYPVLFRVSVSLFLCLVPCVCCLC